MTPAERLTDMLGGETAQPVLSPETIADCLLIGAVPDADGNYDPSAQRPRAGGARLPSSPRTTR